MELPTELGKYGPTGTAIAALGVLLWVITAFLKFLKEESARRDRVNDKLSNSFDNLHGFLRQRDTEHGATIKEIAVNLKEVAKTLDRVDERQGAQNSVIYEISKKMK